MPRAEKDRRSAYAKGRDYEYQVRDILIAEGFIITRSAGSKGPFDLIGIGPQSVRLVKVRTPSNPYTKAEKEKMAKMPCPDCCSIEIWTKIKYQPWEIEIVRQARQPRQDV